MSWYSSVIVDATVVVVVVVDVVDVVVVLVVDAALVEVDVVVEAVVAGAVCVAGGSSGARVVCTPTLPTSVSLVTSTDTVPHAAVDTTSTRSPATLASRAAIDRTVPVARLPVRSPTDNLSRVSGAASSAAPAGRYDNHPFIQACRGLPHDRVPVWFMRQAGRSLPEYRAIRGTGTILDAIADPDLSTEITLQPIRRYDVDAAILYSDIVVPAHAVGFGLTVTPGVGPEVERPFRHEDDLARLRPVSYTHLTLPTKA